MREDDMSPYGDDPLCPVCDRPVPPGGKKGGRPRQYCSRRCGLVDFHLRKALRLVDEVAEHASPNAKLALRQMLWQAGNQIRPYKGHRKPGTTFLRVDLSCEHSKDLKARSRVIGGGSVLDAPPRTTLCCKCEGRPRRDVVRHAFLVQRKNGMVPSPQ
jgi:hypothetical protein